MGVLNVKHIFISQGVSFYFILFYFIREPERERETAIILFLKAFKHGLQKILIKI